MSYLEREKKVPMPAGVMDTVNSRWDYVKFVGRTQELSAQFSARRHETMIIFT